MDVTIKDIAQKAGVSVSTVSRVLRDEGYYAEKTGEKVLKTAREMGYRVNIIGKSLRSKETKVIGHLSIGESSNPYYGKVIQGIDISANKEGYNVIVCNTYRNKDIEKKQVNMLLSRRVDGLIITGYIYPDNINIIKNTGVPAVILERPANIDGIDRVLVNNRQAVFKAVSYLLDQGHREIMFLGKKEDCEIEKERLVGYKLAYRERGFDFKSYQIVLAEEYDFEPGKELFRKYYQKYGLDMTAVVVINELMTMGVLQVLNTVNKKVPDDISLISFDDIQAHMFSPPLTAIKLPVEEMAQTAFNLLIDRINNPNLSVREVNLEADLIFRKSVKSLDTS